MKLRVLIALFACACIPAVTFPLAAQPDNAGGEPQSAEKLWRINGYIESENYFMVNPNAKASRNEYPVTKVEQHASLDVQVGKETIHARGVAHGYLYPTDKYTSEGVNKNSLLVNELYVRYINSFLELKAGRQVIRWGTADSANPTSYFTPLNISEFLLKSEDEHYLGVDAFLLKFFFKDYSLQLVCLPVATYNELPGTNSPWTLRFPRVSIPILSTYADVTYRNETPKRSLNKDNICYGGRFTGSVSGVDFSFSGYHGIDMNVTLLPKIISMGFPSIIHVVPKYNNVTAFGFDIAYSISQVTLLAEMSYSFDKMGVTKADMSTMPPAPPALKKTHYFAYTAGINWLIDGDDFNIALEFFQNYYLTDRDDFEDPFISDYILFQITKKFLNSSIILEARAMFNVMKYDWMLRPLFGYDFQNGFTLELEADVFKGKRDTLFGSYQDRDILSVRGKYQF